MEKFKKGVFMEITLNNRTVVFTKSGDKYYPVALSIDGIHIQKFESFYEAERAAKELCNKYPQKESL